MSGFTPPPACFPGLPKCGIVGFIFIVRLGDDEEAAREHVNQFFRDNPALESLTAVKNNRVIFLDKRLYNMKPNNLWAEAYLQLEDILLEG